MMAYEPLASVADLRSGEMAGYRIGGKRVVVLCVQQRFYAYPDRCAHLGLPLSEGTLHGEVLTCRAHGYEYDARTGRGLNPRRVCLRGYPVKVHDGHVYVDLSEGGPS